METEFKNKNHHVLKLNGGEEREGYVDEDGVYHGVD